MMKTTRRRVEERDTSNNIPGTARYAVTHRSHGSGFKITNNSIAENLDFISILYF